MPSPRDTAEVTGTARMLVVLLAFAWGLNWISVSIGLRGAPPWTLRFLGAGLGALTLIVAATLSGHTLRVPRGERVHVMVAGFLNVALFQILSTFAQLNGATSRVIILAYSMPIWTTIMGRLLLGERLTTMRRIAIALCIVGLAILVWPLFAHGIPITVVLGLACAWCWCGATVYLKWVKATVPPLANAAWQLVFGFLFIAGGTFIFEGVPHLNGISRDTWLAILFMGVIGTGLAHFLWWSVAARLPAITASIGALLVPVIGVVASTIVLHERPTVNDIVGFALIFSAASCVLLQPGRKRIAMPE
ncbi:MAG TPA: DMT family transporter [Pseudolabrys sp.]|uniref:DMT family transporter n=1 Tax=Pseudolabrys sp. TaxID=1960880 RepID=UPI002DDD6D72|nr:DMT family transporter [Pseudolabrys sp.]HEV2630964.1 DMT family transporter [Pseudolabrys sp.]